MANIKITDLTAYAAPRTTDVIPIVDVTTDTTKKVAVGEIVGKITGDVDVATDGTSSIAAGAIVNADVNASAAIAGTKIAPNFGSQTIETTGVISSSRLLVGTSSDFGGGNLQVANGSINIGTFIGATSGAYEFIFEKSRSSTVGTDTLVANGDTLGQITFKGGDGSQQVTAAFIRAGVDGTPGANDMPGRLVFFTTADGASTPTERMRIESNGNVRFPSIANIYQAGGGGIHLGNTGLFSTNGSGTLQDNTRTLGSATFRWSVVYAGTGTINTSDVTLKQDIESLDVAELNVAAAIKGLIKKFRFTDAVNEKGDDARIHIGVIAQEVEQAFVAEGLDPRRYGLFCEDTLEDGSKRLGIRYDELLAFVIAALQ